MLGSAASWCTVLLAVVAAMLPHFVALIYHDAASPTLLHETRRRLHDRLPARPHVGDARARARAHAQRAITATAKAK